MVGGGPTTVAQSRVVPRARQSARGVGGGVGMCRLELPRRDVVEGEGHAQAVPRPTLVRDVELATLSSLAARPAARLGVSDSSDIKSSSMLGALCSASLPTRCFQNSESWTLYMLYCFAYERERRWYHRSHLLHHPYIKVAWGTLLHHTVHARLPQPRLPPRHIPTVLSTAPNTSHQSMSGSNHGGAHSPCSSWLVVQQNQQQQPLRIFSD